jgi:hypothetical protein
MRPYKEYALLFMKIGGFGRHEIKKTESLKTIFCDKDIGLN